MTVSTNYDTKPWIKMPVDELVTPKAGKICKGPAWWAVTPDNCVLFFKSYNSPQCNQQKAIVERIRPGLEAREIPMAYLPHRCEDY
jgi:hypothetical protein